MAKKTRADKIGRKEKKRGYSLKNLRVPLIFCAIVILLNLLSLYAAEKGYLYFFELFNAKTITWLIHFFGIEAQMNNTIIYLANNTWKINTECTAITIMIVFASFVLIYPASIKTRAVGLLSGIPFIFAANMLRLLFMAFIDKFKPAYSVYFHDYLWQVAFIIMVIFMWLIWIEKVANRESKTAVPR
ncbi:MAG: archaeosortase/exosortase family protein [Nitrospirae bacterium]|nr:archaeosortase/exosortase family protein [Nitrospirota bacterium]